MPSDRALWVSRAVVWVAAFIVPRRCRARWAREWDAELAGWWRHSSRSRGSYTQLCRRTALALHDAVAARRGCRDGRKRVRPARHLGSWSRSIRLWRSVIGPSPTLFSRIDSTG